MLRLVPAISAVLLVLALAPVAAAGPPQSVDPGTLTPPPNPTFDWDCVSSDQGITCRGERTFGAVDVSFFGCEGNPILITFVQSEKVHRFHDEAGRVIRTHIVGTFDETWRLEGSPIVLTSRGRWSETFRYAVPGDTTTRTHELHGVTLKVSAPGLGVIAHDVGVVKLNWDGSELLALHGPHDFFDFDAALVPVCKAFGV